MAKIAINLLGYIESDQYPVDVLKYMLDSVQFDLKEIERLGVVVSELPDKYATINKKLVKERIRKAGSLEDVIARRRAAKQQQQEEDQETQQYNTDEPT